MSAPATSSPPRAPSSPAASTKLVRAVQACRRKVAGLGDEDSWRAFLAQTTGKESLRVMTGRELGRVLDALHRAGAPRLAGAGAGQPKLDDRPQVRLARALWIELADTGAVRNRSEAGLETFAKRVTGKARLAWCKPADLNKLVEALKDWRDRADAADPVVKLARQVDAAQPPDRDKALARALWQALIELGVMRHGIHADIGTWLTRQQLDSMSVDCLTPENAAEAVKRLGDWLRDATRKAKTAANGEAG